MKNRGILEEVKWCVKFVAYRSRVNAVRGQSMRIVVFIALFVIALGVTVAFVIEANRTITTLDCERLWFKVETNNTDSAIGSAFIYTEDDIFLEQIMLLNTMEWQGSSLEYEERSSIRVYIDLWHIDEIIPERKYVIGRGEEQYIGEEITITMVSYWG
ncbi:unnamed protein product, partial [marine sediment metagenome]